MARVHVAHHLEELAVFADDERHAVRVLTIREHPEGPRRLTRRVAEDWIVELEILCEGSVRLGRIDAGRIDRDLEALELFAALPERLALCGSPTCKCFWKPSDHHDLASEVVGELMGLAIRTHERERRRGVPGLQG